MSLQWGMQIDFSCLPRVHTPAEAVEKQMVSAQSVGVHAKSACSPQQHEQVKLGGHAPWPLVSSEKDAADEQADPCSWKTREVWDPRPAAEHPRP